MLNYLKRKNKLLKSLLVLIGIITVILILLPGFAKLYAIKHSSELIGREIYLDKVKVNYFTGTIRLIDFRMFESNNQDNFISFDTLLVNIEPLQLLKNKIEIEEFFLKSLDVNVIMKDSLFNFEDLITFHTTKEDTINNDVDEGNLYKYSLSNLELSNADFHFNNQDIEHITNIENISFMVPFISWDQEEKSNADVKFNFPRGGYFESKLNINPIDGEYDADLTISDLYLDPFYKYVAEYSEINSFNGVVNSKIHLEGNINEGVKTIVSGKVNVVDFSMTDTNNNTFLSAKKMDATIQNLDYFKSSYIIDSLNINDSYTHFQLDSISNNFYRIFKLDSTNKISDVENQTDANDTINDNSGEDLYYAINHLEINKGVLDYTDNLTGRPFNYHLSDIDIKTDSISSNSEWINIRSEMLLNKRGTLIADLGINPSNPLYTNLNFSIENFLLSDINIYSDHYTSHTILDGDLFYSSKSIISNGNIESENNFLIKNVSLNKSESGGLYSLPLKFALFILKDENGDVELEIPLEGDLNDPSINISKMVWKAFSNLIIKVATSPVRLLAGIVGGEPKDIEEIRFNYLETTLSDKTKKQLDKLLEIEKKKDGIKIEMIYYVDEQLQKETIAKKEVGKLYFKETKKDYLKDESGFEAFLLSKSTSDSLNDKPSYLAIVDPKIVDSIIVHNSKALFSNIENYLHMVNKFTQIKIKPSDLNDPINVGEEPTLKMKFSLLEEE